jgi:hypothetical protein
MAAFGRLFFVPSVGGLATVDVAHWHKTDVPLASTNVRSWGNGEHVLEMSPLPSLTLNGSQAALTHIVPTCPFYRVGTH